MTLMKTLKHLKFLALSVFVLISIISCQQEAIDISQPNDNQSFTATSEVSKLMAKTATNDGSVDNIIDKANCLEVKLPVTVIVNDIQITINSALDYDLIEDIYDQFADDIDKLDIQFPITIISGDFTETVINNQAELEELIKSCVGENEPDDDIECIDFQYPISISLFNTSFDVIDTKTINNDQELYIFLENLDDNTLASLNFPVTMVLADGSTVVVNNNEELISTINQAKDSCDEDDDYDYGDDDLDCDVVSIKENLKECFWEIKNDNGTTNLHIKFKSDFSFVVTNPNGVEEATGVWTVEKEGDFTYIKLNSNYQDFNGSWKIVECGDHFYEMLDAAGNFIKIVKDCPSNTNIAEVKEFIKECKWYMYYLKVNGEDLTAQYHDYHFEFREDGTFIMTTGNDQDVHEGTWVVQEIATGGVAITLSSPTLTGDINDYYLLADLNEHKMILQGEQEHTLKLERVCDTADNQADRVRNTMKECTWSVYYFELNGDDVTQSYEMYFNFKEDGTFVAEGNGQNYEGEWSVNTIDESTVVVISSQTLPVELTDEYTVTFDSEDKIHFVDNEQSILKILKNCN
ncbi:hypothetical protein EV195_103159 [Tenacibaculum skagerrakense]|uniref:Lipocalin-like protein n=2 Tax=Tenacibaculum skagerrakense TaxID=186571 RepID=A0A4R2NUN0_9FLAO|nr:hypothetical protein EV195_103159 [Tenacibaculum skagerrakense]